MLLEEMHLDGNVLGARSHSWAGGCMDGAVVIFKTFGESLGVEIINKIKGFTTSHLFQDLMDRDETAHALRQSNVLAFSS